MTIDLTEWLNAATNMPDVWRQLIDEALTNRHGDFTYNYHDTITRKKDGEPIYVKDYTIDLKINIDTKYSTDENLDEYEELSQQQKERINKLTQLFQLCQDYFSTGNMDKKAVQKVLNEIGEG